MNSIIFSKAFVLYAQCILAFSTYNSNLDYDHDNKKLICPLACNQMACAMGILTCSETGLSEIPRKLPQKTNKILLINQDFSEAGPLTKYNLSEYSASQHNITKITIQNCSLLAIKSEAFSKLNYLQTLDLSFNKITLIEPYTFADLRLVFLRLDGNDKLKFTVNSFKDLQVASLSLIGCQLTYLPFSILEPIYLGLTKLMLTNNHLTTLESKYENLFQQLSVFGLAENRFDCSQCSLMWMANSLKLRFYKNKAKDSQTMIYPQCYMPYKMKGKLIHSLSASDFQCPKPSIEKMSISILSNNTAQLICTASDLQSSVMWSKIIEPNEEISRSLGKQIYISNSIHSSKLLVNQNKEVDLFLCTVTSPIGNTSSTRLQISWPPNKTRSKSSNSSKKSLSKELYTPIPVDKYSKNYFFQPQFSLIEMIYGVVGTFIATLIVFITMLRCIFYRIRLFSKNSQLRNHQLTISSSKKDKRKQYIAYEPPIYSDSQTYDIPSLPTNQSVLGQFLDFKTQKTLYGEKNP